MDVGIFHSVRVQFVRVQESGQDEMCTRGSGRMRLSLADTRVVLANYAHFYGLGATGAVLAILSKRTFTDPFSVVIPYKNCYMHL